ncbi:flagellar biosynthetic protein FliO [Pseudaminobacter sp. 19-2017]|uniref:Flagellar biosynthetic protein FliO n=1 Tax=Pseudaminobacter soli (ex Zhang et al. 2022) TaxID=2831468 RepID=A0A942I9M9_9HYPH|nr:flagellar biosynthetic protein FliO [Pseudaminobacter soli]MBS3649551.1 flagellar biosynthetic protein FliO [Pseudaminobacter soli]
MLDWLDAVAGTGYSQAVLWTLLALLLLVVLLIVIKLVRSMTFGTFVAGGRNRKARLAVMDATAVDTHRRLVLIRRDDVEHLLLIGGSSDIVVERDIRIAQTRRPMQPAQQELVRDLPAGPAPIAPPPAPVAPQPAPVPPSPIAAASQPQPAPQPRRVEPARVAPQQRPAPQRQEPSLGPAQRPEPPRPASPPLAAAPQPAPLGEPMIAPQGPPAPPLQAAPPPPPADDLDDDLLKELEVSLDEDETKPAPGQSKERSPASLDDEMARLLGELSRPRR